MGIDGWVAENGRHAVFESLRDEVFETFRFFVHFIPGVFEDVVKKKLEKAMVADEFPRAASACGSEASAAMLLVLNQRRTLQREPLQHARH